MSAVSPAFAAKSATESAIASKDEAAAASERARQLAATKGSSPDEVDRELAVVRAALESEPASERSDRLRLELCATRRALGERGSVAGTGGTQEQADLATSSPPVEIAAAVSTPPNTLRDRMHGDQLAVIRSTIDADGCVTPERVLFATSVEWSGYAREQVARWVFRPATTGGHPMPARFDLKVRYKRR